jgi:hypothetical protein
MAELIIQKHEEELKKNRDRMKITRDNDEYRANNKIYMKEYRTNKKAELKKAYEDINKPDYINNTINVVKIDTDVKLNSVKIDANKGIITPLWKRTGIKGSSLKTAKIYTIRFIKVHKEYKNEVLNDCILNRIFLGKYDEPDETYILKNTKYLVNENLVIFIEYMKNKYTNISTLKAYMTPFVAICSFFAELEPSYQVLARLVVDLNDLYENQRDNNEITIENSKKLFDFTPEAINTILDKITNINDKLIYSLYTLIPPRRLEYATVLIVDNIDNTKNGNFLVIDKNDKYNLKFIFNDFKTVKAFGSQIIENLPCKLVDIIYEYLVDNGKCVGNYLFSKKNNTSIANVCLGRRLSVVFSKIYNTEVSLRYIRMSYSIYINSLGLTNNQLKNKADLMCHSVRVNSQYNKTKVTG